MSASITPDEVTFLAKMHGLSLNAGQVSELVEVYPLIARAKELIHQPRGREAEPSNIFVPGQGAA